MQDNPYRAPGRRAPPSLPPDNNPYYAGQQEEPASKKYKNYVLWTILGTAYVAGCLYLGWKIAGNVTSNQANKGSLDSNDPAYFAKQFNIGFENNGKYGADTDTIRRAMLAIPTKDFFSKVASNYSKQYKSSLYKDLELKLKTTEYQEMQAIYKIKPQKATGKDSQPIYDPYAWADRIHAAVNYETAGWFWGTDEEAIKEVMREIPDQKTWDDVKAAYDAKYSLNIDDDIDGDLDPDDYDFRAELKKRNIAA